MLHSARCKCRTQKSRQKSPSGHHRAILSGCIFASKARIDNRKLLSSSVSSTCPHNMVNFGPPAAEIVSLVWDTPGNFNGFRVLAALLHGTLVVGVSQNAALNRGRHLYSAGRPSRWALAHILVLSFFFSRLISAAADWMSAILPHCLSANLRCRSETCCTLLAENRMQKSRQKSPSGHHRAILLGHVFATKARIDNRKKLVKQQYLLYMS